LGLTKVFNVFFLEARNVPDVKKKKTRHKRTPHTTALNLMAPLPGCFAWICERLDPDETPKGISALFPGAFFFALPPGELLSPPAPCDFILLALASSTGYILPRRQEKKKRGNEVHLRQLAKRSTYVPAFYKLF
jgi:hypothetical protein